MSSRCKIYGAEFLSSARQSRAQCRARSFGGKVKILSRRIPHGHHIFAKHRHMLFPRFGRRLFSTLPAATESSLPLEGQVAWVVGGVGIVGSGLAHGLLAAGATVIVNSRHEQRLEKISEAMGHPARLVTVGASMLPGRAEITVEQVMDMTSNQLDHVVAHAGGRPWASGGGDETSTTYNRGSVLHIPADEYASAASQLGSFHFAAASLLLPRLTDAGKGSYTFVTSSTSAAWGPRSYMTQVNSYGVMGLAGGPASALAHRS